MPYPRDPFADIRGSALRYYNDVNGWILGSAGPDRDQAIGGDLRWDQGDLKNDVESLPHAQVRLPIGQGVEGIYTSNVAQPSTLLLTGSGSGKGHGAYTYDPSNGLHSEGDIWRVKQ